MRPPTDLPTLEHHVRAALRSGDATALGVLLRAAHPADLADVLDRFGSDDQGRVLAVLAPAQAAAVLHHTGADTTRRLLAQLPPDQAGALLERLPPDDVAALVTDDAPERQQAVLSALDPHDAAAVRSVLQYPPQSAGRMMVPHFVRAGTTDTVADALQLLRRLDREVQAINDVYLLDGAGQPVGVARLRDVLAAPTEQRLTELLQPQLLAVAPHTDQEEVARLVSQYDLSSLPVVAADGRMLGIITVDDVIDVLVEETTEDVLRFGGVVRGAAHESYFAVPILRAVRRRVVWLLLLFLTGTVTVNVLGFFQEALAQVVALSFFIPLLIGTGGNTGAQTVSTLVRGLALGEVQGRDVWRVLRRELIGGVVLGLLLSGVGFAVALLQGNSARLALVVAVSVVAICTWANVIGAVVPLLARRVGLDPALVSAPLITTLVDATGLAIYLLIARALLGV